MELISQREFARRVGVAHTAIQKAIKESRLQLVDGKIDYDTALPQWNNTRSPGNNNRCGELPGDQAAPDYFDERAKLTKAQRIKTELEVAVMRGELHHAEDVELVMNGMIAAFRTRMLAIPTKAAGDLQGKTSLTEIQATLRKHIHEALGELSTYDPEAIHQHAEHNRRKVARPSALHEPAEE